MPEKRVGKVEHYYPKAKAAAVGLERDLHVGDEIHIVGHGDDVRKKVTSMQLNHVPIQGAHAGEHVGIGLATKVHEGDDVLLVDGQSSAGSPKATPAAGRTAPSKTARRGARKPAKAAKKAKVGKRAKAAKKGKASRRSGKSAAKRAKPKKARKAKAAKVRKAKAGKARKAPRRAKSARKSTRKRR